jgi:3-oxoacyl-[acyl-carrier protein] reductase
MFKLKGKNALITGATGGIGAEIAKKLVLQGANVVISGTREERLLELQKEIGEDKCKYLTCNLSDSKEVDGLFEKAEELVGGAIDILVCNAGITKDNLALRIKDEDFDDVINVNLKSTFILNRNAIKKMIRRKYGRIINIASVVGFTGNPGQANYVASKAGMVGMTKSFAQEVASRGITINCVAPGFIQTAMTDVLNEQQKSGILSSIPMQKMGTPEDIACGVAFLASNEAGYLTGQTLHINGGMLML